MYILDQVPGQCMTVRLTLTHFYYHHHHLLQISSAGNSEFMNMFACFSRLPQLISLSFLTGLWSRLRCMKNPIGHQSKINLILKTSVMYLMFLLLILHHQLDLCPAFHKQSISSVLNHAESRMAILGHAQDSFMN